jgi:hypothetical protein
MRRSRLVAAFTLAAIALIAGGSALIGSANAARSRPAAGAGTAPLARHAPTQLARALKSLELQFQRSSPSSPPRQPGPRVLPVQPLFPHATSCFVAAGGCSETPCVEFAGQMTGATAVATTAAVVLRLSGPVTRNVVSPAGGQACQGHLGTPKIFRVSGP